MKKRGFEVVSKYRDANINLPKGKLKAVQVTILKLLLI